MRYLCLIAIASLVGCNELNRSESAKKPLEPTHPQVLVQGVDGTVMSGELLNGSVTVDSGQGEMVLIVQGSSARLTPETEKLPVDATIIGIVDTVNVENKTIFSAKDQG